MSTEGVEVDFHPSFVVPSMVLLHVVTMVIAIYMVANAFIILTGDWHTIDVERYMLVQTVINFGGSAKTAMFTVTSGEKVSVDVESSSKRKFVV
jgi:hypothetical protein